MKKKFKINETSIFLVVIFILTFCISSCDVLLAPATTPSYTQGPPPSCTDVEFLGLFSRDGGIGIKIYTAKIRNKSSYTKNVNIAFEDMYGQTQKKSFDVKAGEMIDGELTIVKSTDRRPVNVRMTSCY